MSLPLNLVFIHLTITEAWHCFALGFHLYMFAGNEIPTYTYLSKLNDPDSLGLYKIVSSLKSLGFLFLLLLLLFNYFFLESLLYFQTYVKAET